MVALLLVVGGVSAAGLQAQAAPEDRLQVLFLGDEAHHEPYARAKELLPALAANGIDMFYTDNLDHLDAEYLDSFHALIFYHNHPAISRDQIQALLGFVENGGGLVALHSASASFQNSEEYIRLVGGAFLSHGEGTFSADRVMPDHPAIQNVPVFETWDETYIHTKHNPVNRTVLEVRREDGHEEPWTWVRTYGEGRVFYTAWGHDERTWGTAGFRNLVGQGVRWASGDWAFDARPDEPTPQITQLDVPFPTYVEDAPWNTLGDPVWEGQLPLTPEESRTLTTLPPGFSMETFVAEPMIGRIVDFAWDERGRMWAAETNDYPNNVLPVDEPGNDRILILEDTNGDNQVDEVTVFADGLNLVTTLAFADGGLIVGQAPHIYFMQDTDGDDVADVKEIVMTDWPRHDTHGQINNFRYDFNNQILATSGYNGYQGQIGERSWGPGDFYAGYFHFAPDGSSMDYLARTDNNSWGVGQTEDGFIVGSTANGIPSTFVHIPGRYYRTLGLREPLYMSIADRADIYPNRDIRQVDWFGLYTSGAAHEVYTARAFPEEYWNTRAFVTDPTGYLVGQFDLSRDGTAFKAKNRWSFLMSRDGWLAPVQAKVGPDGALWISDFYTQVAQHNPTPNYPEAPGYEDVPCCPHGEGNAHETPNRDAEHARIHRISYDEAPEYEPMRLDDATPEELVQELSNDNLFWRFTAQRLLVEGGFTEVVPALIALVDDHTVDDMGLNPGALHALWTLDGLGAIESDADAMRAAREALYHPATSLRRAALMILPRDEQLENDIFAAGLLPDRNAPGVTNIWANGRILQDADPSVRMEAVLALSELEPSERAATVVLDLINIPVNARDRWFPDAVAVAAYKHAPDLAVDLLQQEHRVSDEEYLAGIRTVVQFLAHAHAAHGNTEALVTLIEALPETHPELATGVLVGISGHLSGEDYWRTEWGGRGAVDAGGWPDDETVTLSEDQRERVRAAASQTAVDFDERFTHLAERWGVPDLFD